MFPGVSDMEQENIINFQIYSTQSAIPKSFTQECNRQQGFAEAKRKVGCLISFSVLAFYGLCLILPSIYCTAALSLCTSRVYKMCLHMKIDVHLQSHMHIRCALNRRILYRVLGWGKGNSSSLSGQAMLLWRKDHQWVVGAQHSSMTHTLFQQKTFCDLSKFR